MSEDLIEQIRKQRLGSDVSEKEMELAIAFLKGLISLSELGASMATSKNEKQNPATTAYRRLPRILKHAALNGLIKF